MNTESIPTFSGRVLSKINSTKDKFLYPEKDTEHKLVHAKQHGRLLGKVNLPTKTIYAYTY